MTVCYQLGTNIVIYFLRRSSAVLEARMAQALAECWVLATHNTRHFERVPGLAIEDWLV